MQPRIAYQKEKQKKSQNSRPNNLTSKNEIEKKIIKK